MATESETLAHKHFWMEIESDNKGIPTKYRCIKCLIDISIPSRDKTARDYLRQKYNK